MITVDTNVWLRIFLQDDTAQAREAMALQQEAADEGELLYISPFSFLELVWTLGKKGFARSQIALQLDQLLNARHVVVGHRQAVTQALVWYRAGKADFADYLIHADGVVAGAKEMVTFDEAFVREDKKRRRRPRRWKAV